MRFQVAIARRHGIEAVVGKNDRLRILELGKHFRFKDRIPIALASPGFIETGKLSAHTAPLSINSGNGGRGIPYLPSRFNPGS